jgi:hypothetical protein
LGSQNTVAATMRLAGFDSRKLMRGKVLRRYPLYLAASPAYGAQKMTPWIQALEQMKGDGTYQRILDKYHYEQ